jgi:Bacterial Ig-like domain
MKSGNSHRLLLGTGGALLLSTLLPAAADVIAAWETTGQSSFGTQNLAPTTGAPGLVVGGLTRGSGVSTGSGTSTANAWGGQGFDTESIEDGVAAGNFITFTVTPGSGAEVSFETLDLHYRRDGSGPVSAALQFQVGSSGFIDVEEIPLDSNTTAGGTIIPVDLTGYEELQGVSGQTVTFRLVPYGTTDAGDDFFIYGPIAGADLVLEGQITGGSGGDTLPPLVNGLTPADDSTGIPGAGTTLLTMTFNENVARGSGQILVRRSATGQTAYSLDVTNSAQVTLSANQIGLVLPAALDSGTDYHVEIPAGAILDQAVPPNSYAGLAGSAAWNFATAVVVTPPRVVVNKYLNGSPDRVELLVIGTGSPGSTVDLRGMILKDFSGDMSGDAGGKLLFADTSLWSAVPAGTLVTLSNSVTTSDLAPGDFKLAVGLGDPSYFTPVPGSPALDITATDMVMIKDAGSDPAGTAGGIHALAAGAASPTSSFTLFAGAKLRATATTGSNQGVRAANSTSSLADYMTGTDATGSLSLALSDFGAPNTGTNAAYISTLRGRAPGDGDGIATVVNATLSSPFLGLRMFEDAQVNQSAKLTLVPRISGVTLTTVRIVVPPEVGSPGSVILSGTGAAGASWSASGQTIDIASAAATTAAPLEVTIGGLVTPVPTSISDNGNYPLVVSTAASGGILTPIASQAPVRVVIPISALRDVDSEGVPLDAGAVVAVEGTVTEADFGPGAANFSGFLQDSTAGINVFSPSLFLGLVRGNRFTIAGTISQTNGLTTLIPAAGSQIVNRGPVTEARALFVPLADLFANPEAYEGRLVTVKNLTLDSGAWGPAASVILRDSALVPVEIRIQSGSTATTAPTFPATVTGIFSQSDTSAPFSSAYQLLPRDSGDLRAWVDDVAAWFTATGTTGGLTGDPDFDGKNNAFEYAFGLNPLSGSSNQPIISGLDRSTGKFTYTRRSLALAEVNIRIETSTDLVGWTEDLNATQDVIAITGDVETVEVTLSAPKPLAAPKIFIRVETD